MIFKKRTHEYSVKLLIKKSLTFDYIYYHLLAKNLTFDIKKKLKGINELLWMQTHCNVD